MPEDSAALGVTQIDLEVLIRAAPERVWRALVNETTRWWNRDFYTSPKTKAFTIEPRLGGRAFEDWGDGAGAVWYTITSIDPPALLTLLGHLFPAYGGPSTTMLQIELAAEGPNTRVKLSDSIFGRVGKNTHQRVHEG